MVSLRFVACTTFWVKMGALEDAPTMTSLAGLIALISFYLASWIPSCNLKSVCLMLSTWPSNVISIGTKGVEVQVEVAHGGGVL